jgi:hypothetical protein
MLMTHNPSNTSQTNTVDNSQPTPYEITYPAGDSAELPTGAPLIFPDANPTPIAGQQNKFRQLGHFIADYGDRRAQAKYVCYSHLGRVSLVVGCVLWLIGCHRHSNIQTPSFLTRRKPSAAVGVIPITPTTAEVFHH